MLLLVVIFLTAFILVPLIDSAFTKPLTTPLLIKLLVYLIVLIFVLWSVFGHGAPKAF
jgi:hypothetical protein